MADPVRFPQSIRINGFNVPLPQLPPPAVTQATQLATSAITGAAAGAVAGALPAKPNSAETAAIQNAVKPGPQLQIDAKLSADLKAQRVQASVGLTFGRAEKPTPEATPAPAAAAPAVAAAPPKPAVVKPLIPYETMNAIAPGAGSAMKAIDKLHTPVVPEGTPAPFGRTPLDAMKMGMKMGLRMGL